MFKVGDKVRVTFLPSGVPVDTLGRGGVVKHISQNSPPIGVDTGEIWYYYPGDLELIEKIEVGITTELIQEMKDHLVSYTQGYNDALRDLEGNLKERDNG